MQGSRFISNNNEEKLAWLRLARSKGVGHRQMERLLQLYGSPCVAVKAWESGANQRLRSLTLASRASIEAELQAVEKFGAQIMTGCDPDFPEALHAIDDPPLAITWRGRQDLLKQPILAIVGARNASLAGMQLAANFAGDLAQQGVIVISGLARGIDRAAHIKALAYQRTIAVIAGGIDHIYPRENEKLFAQIAEQGLLLTEAPFGTQPQAQQFPRRNRLISGLALGVLVIEAGLRSGSLSTANFALQQGRELFVVPGSPLDPRSQGCNLLIKRGAYLVENIDDILPALSLASTPAINAPAVLPIEEKQRVIAPEGVAASIVNLLSQHPVSIAAVAAQLDLPLSLVNQVIVELELAGQVERKMGNMVNGIKP